MRFTPSLTQFGGSFVEGYVLVTATGVVSKGLLYSLCLEGLSQ